MKEARELVECSREDANNYSKILSAIGMEEEGDPVGEVASMKSQLDACRPYLKEGETVADAMARLERSGSFYRRRCEALQEWQSSRRKT